MGWTYRVIKRPIGPPDHRDTEYGLVEYYDDGGYTADLIEASAYASHEDEPSDAKAIASLRWQLKGMLKALDEPIVEGAARVPDTLYGAPELGAFTC